MFHSLIGVPSVVVHTRYWAAAFGGNAATLAPALEGGIALATTRFRFGDDFTLQEYLGTLALPVEADGAAFARRLCAALPGALCAPSKQVAEKNVTTIGLGDVFVGGFLAKLSEIGRCPQSPR